MVCCDVEKIIDNCTFESSDRITEIILGEDFVKEIVINKHGRLIKSNVFYSMGPKDIYKLLINQHHGKPYKNLP